MQQNMSPQLMKEFITFRDGILIVVIKMSFCLNATILENFCKVQKTKIKFHETFREVYGKYFRDKRFSVTNG